MVFDDEGRVVLAAHFAQYFGHGEHLCVARFGHTQMNPAQASLQGCLCLFGSYGNVRSFYYILYRYHDSEWILGYEGKSE